MAILRIIYPLLFVVSCVTSRDIVEDISPLPEEQFVVKPNCGTIFERIARIQLTTSHWYRTIAIKLPGELPVLSHNLSLRWKRSSTVCSYGTTLANVASNGKSST